MCPNLGTNVTEVDLFGLVQQYTVEGIVPVTFQPGALTAGFLSTARRPTLFNTLQSFGPPWSNLIVGNNGARVRAISPNHAIHATIPPLNGLFPANQLDAYITQVFARYISAPPIVATVFPVPNVTYNFTGLTQGGELVFSDPNKGGAIFSLLKPTTFNAYEGSFPLGSVKPGGSLCPDPPPPLSAACLAYKAVSASLQGALMRTTLLVNNSLDDPLVVPGATGCVKSQFYVNPPVNMYAKLWHDAGIGGKAYGFGFDDTCDQSSFQLIFNPTRLTITLLGSRP